MFYNRPNYANAVRVLRACRYHKKLVNKNIKAINNYIWRGYSSEEVKEILLKEQTEIIRKSDLESKL